MNRHSHNPGRAAAAGLVLALAGLGALPAVAQPGHAGMHGEHGPAASMQMSERMFDKVNATPEQRTQIRQIMQSAATDMQAQRESRKALQEQAMKLFTQPTVDANAVEALRQQQLAQHDQSSKRMMQAMIETSRVLTPEQRVKMAEAMKQRRDMAQRHMRERRGVDLPKTEAPKS
ncbi:MAG TPA: Spy/CpxP family protein refolding chaperone [Rubrivivax sp.]